MPERRYRISASRPAVLTVDIDADLYDGGVYILVADKFYKKTKSRIVYIGMTTKGAKRIAESAAKHITNALENDILKLEAFAYEVIKNENETYSVPAILESALIARHKERFGYLPFLNKRGGLIADADPYFTKSAIDKILDKHSGCRAGFWAK